MAGANKNSIVATENRQLTSPSWPEYLKEIARRTKAGFGLVHTELLQRKREWPTRHASVPTISGRTERPTRPTMTSKVHSHKSTEREGEDSKRRTFVSYVSEEECNFEPKKSNEKFDQSYEKFDQSSAGSVTVKNATAPPQNLAKNENSERDAHETDSLAAQMETVSNLKSEFGKTKPKPRLGSRNFSNAKNCTGFSKLRAASTGSVEEMHPKPCKGNKETYNGEKDAQNDRPYYSNLDQLTETDEIYSTPQSPNSVEVVSYSPASHEKASSSSPHKGIVSSTESICADQHQSKSKTRPSEVENDYLRMSGCIQTPESHDSLLYYSARGQNRSEYANAIWQTPSTLINFTTSVQSSPSVRAIYQHSGDETVNITNSDDSCVDENEYIDPDGVEAARARGPVSATVSTYTPEAVSPTVIIRPRTRPFILYTVEEVVECFEECALPQLAGICRDESLDGDYFRDTSNEDLAHEPFCLDSFYISKVRKVIAGWRPKRRSTYK